MRCVCHDVTATVGVVAVVVSDAVGFAADRVPGEAVALGGTALDPENADMKLEKTLESAADPAVVVDVGASFRSAVPAGWI